MASEVFLAALDSLGGQAIYRRGDTWFLISIDDDWKPRRLDDERAAVRFALTSTAEAREDSFRTQDQLVSFVRECWSKATDHPRVELSRVLHLLPDGVRDALRRRRAPVREPSWSWDISPRGFDEVWARVRRFAGSFIRGRPGLANFLPAEDLAAEAMIGIARSARRRETIERLAQEEKWDQLSIFLRTVVGRLGVDSVRHLYAKPFPRPWPPPVYWPPPPSYALSIERGEVSEDDLVDSSTELPDAAAERIEMEGILIGLLREMPKPSLGVAALRLHEPRLASRDIAKRLGISEEVVRRRWKRALERLREDFRARGLLPQEN